MSMRYLNHLLISVSLVATGAVYAQHHMADHSQHMQETSQQIATVEGKGVVKAINIAKKRVTLTHEPIAELNWPEMTMAFTVKDEAMLTPLNVGDQVNFTLENESLVVALTKR